MRYAVNLLIALDQTANTVVGGTPDETLSARAHRHQHRREWRIARRVINALFWWQADHCAESYASEQQRRHLPGEYRT